MPPRSKKSLAAKQREARRVDIRNTSSLEDTNTYDPPQYRPQDPSLRPYWDAFYENPYPNAEERKKIAERLKMSPQTIQEWFIMARRFTHAPDREPEAGSSDKDEEDAADEDNVSIKGTLYEYFYRDIFTQKPSTSIHSVSKRKSYNDKPASEGTGSRQIVTTARKLVPECLDTASIPTIRHFWRKSWRYMDAYMSGLTGKQAEFAVKKFKSHRRIGKKVMMDITSVLN